MAETAVHNSPRRFEIRIVSRLVIGLILLLCGCMIYVAWRSEQTNICQWIEKIGAGFLIDFLHATVGRLEPGSFVRNNLPDGLYCGAYIFIIDFIWTRSPIAARIFMALLIPLVAIAHEIMQGLGFMPGTFDYLDLLCYALPVILYIIILLIKQHSLTSKNTAT